MRSVNFNRFLYAVLAISAVAWFVIAIIRKIDLLNFLDYIKILPDVVTFDLFIYFIFNYWLWKWKIFRGWLVLYPNLNGTWSGYIKSDYINPKTRNKISPIPVILTIKQSFFKISCVMKTEEMVSHSYGEDFKIDSDRQIKQLIYSYSSKPKISISNRSAIHYGTILFEILEKPKLKLRGEYWTSRKTTGEIVLEYRDKKILDEIPEDLGKHPIE